MVDLLTDAPACARYVLRGRDQKLVETVVGLGLPSQIGDTLNGAAMLGPDEWFALLPEGTVLATGEGQKLSIVDVSARSVGCVVEGSHAVDVLSAGCPLDLARWPIGRAGRTIFEVVEVVIIREAEQRFRIEVWRSFAPWLRTALETAARTLGH